MKYNYAYATQRVSRICRLARRAAVVGLRADAARLLPYRLGAAPAGAGAAAVRRCLLHRRGTGGGLVLNEAAAGTAGL